MSVNLTTGIIPFSELFERLMTLAKMDSFNNEDYAKGLINDIYTRFLPSDSDWSPIVTESALLMTAMYNTGTVACTAGATTLTGTNTVWTATMTANNGWKIKFASLDNIYTFTYVSATSATISPALEGSTNLSGATYTLFKDEYALPSDFDRFLKNGSIYDYSGGKLRNTIEESPRDKFREEFVSDPSDPIYRSMLTGFDTSGYRRVRLNPPPKTAKVYPYEYIPKITPLKEYTTGTVAVTNASATVTGTDTLFTANVSAGMYFRIDGVGQGDSSKWYKVSSVDSNTQLTLDAVYSDATENGVEYTACSAPTSFPSEFHEFILYEAVAVAGASNADVNTELMIARRGDILKRLKNNYKSRRTNTQYKVEDDGYR